MWYGQNYSKYYIKASLRRTARKVSVFGVFLVRIFPHLETECRYSGSLPIQYKCGKIQTRKTLNTDTFYAVTSAPGPL